MMTTDAVTVSWDHVRADQILSYPIKNYVVYYRQHGQGEDVINVTSSQNSVVICDIANRSQYQFRVAVMIDFDGDPEIPIGDEYIVIVNHGIDHRLAGDIVKKTSSGVSPGSLVGIIFGLAVFITIIAVITVMGGLVIFRYQRYDYMEKQGMCCI